MKTKVRVNIENEFASGRRKGWTKLIKSVTDEKGNGYDFAGEFLNDGLKDLPLNSVLVQRNPMGSANNGTMDWRMGRLDADGEITWGEYFCNTNFLDFRDEVKKLVEQNLDELGALIKEKLELERKLEKINEKIKIIEG